MVDDALSLPKGGSISKRSMRRQIQKYFPKILACLVADLESKNPSVRVAAAKVLINKILPDLKATELTGKSGSHIKIELVDYGAETKDNPTT